MVKKAVTIPPELDLFIKSHNLEIKVPFLQKTNNLVPLKEKVYTRMLVYFNHNSPNDTFASSSKIIMSF